MSPFPLAVTIDNDRYHRHQQVIDNAPPLPLPSHPSPLPLRPRPPSHVSPLSLAATVDNNRYCCRQQLPSPLPQSMTMTTNSQEALFVLDCGVRRDPERAVNVFPTPGAAATIRRGGVVAANAPALALRQEEQGWRRPPPRPHPLLVVSCRGASRSGGRPPLPWPGVILVQRRRHCQRRRLPSLPPPSIVVPNSGDNNVIAASTINCHCHQ